MTMKRVIVESPYAGDIDTHVAYAKRCLKDCLNRGEAPIASHLLYTQMLNDFIPEERELGIQAGLAWIDVADAMIFYIDYGVSKGMANALFHAMTKNKSMEKREIGKNPEIDSRNEQQRSSCVATEMAMDRDRDADLYRQAIDDNDTKTIKRIEDKYRERYERERNI